MTTGTADNWNRGVFFALKKIIYLIAAVQFWYGIYYDFEYVYPSKGHVAYGQLPSYGGKLRYLTVIGAICQASYFTLSLLNEFFGSSEHHPKKPSPLRVVKDFLFATFAFPLALNVSVTFWLIFSIDRELILPVSFMEFFPNWLNHVVHTNVLVFAVVEMFISFRKYPNRKVGLTCLFIFNIAYIAWVHFIKYKSGSWVYPILNVLNMPQRIGFFVFASVLGLSFYFVGEFLNSKIWANELKTTKSSAKKHK